MNFAEPSGGWCLGHCALVNWAKARSKWKFKIGKTHLFSSVGASNRKVQGNWDLRGEQNSTV